MTAPVDPPAPEPLVLPGFGERDLAAICAALMLAASDRCLVGHDTLDQLAIDHPDRFAVLIGARRSAIAQLNAADFQANDLITLAEELAGGYIVEKAAHDFGNLLKEGVRTCSVCQLLAAAAGDTMCPGCREGHERDRPALFDEDREHKGAGQ